MGKIMGSWETYLKHTGNGYTGLLVRKEEISLSPPEIFNTYLNRGTCY